MHASKFVTYVVVGLVANLTRLAISALPGGQLDYLLDQFFAIVHTAWVHCKKKRRKFDLLHIMSFCMQMARSMVSTKASAIADVVNKPVVGQSLHRTRAS